MANNNIDKLYITEKEAAHRYGFSRAWFQRARFTGIPAVPYLKLPGSSRILYPVKETDDWFAKHGLQTSTSQTGGK